MSIELAGAFWVIPVVVVMLAISGLIIVVRLFKGPTGPDRVVAIDALTLVGVAAVALGAMISGQIVFLDVAVVLSLVAFLGTVAFAPLFRKSEQNRRERARVEGEEEAGQ
ncbi:monovalent cation/H+ antiporter complex subunit F [Azoarcus taiwanensis]|uniref:PH regulation protein F n=1 Tax=Azoarcus taiwanensis TaxID=666964 RepID=A0A972FCN7_9RHOO|nr:monovalent cation/H+ antiporter complex subunit F [Azoarcus taiwanensis]NMG02190.1 pH regulation protein F [Azoarcus taiwanensis]